MKNFFTYDEIIEKDFVFVSYRSDNKDIVHPDMDILINKGVRAWYDKDLVAGNDWKERVESLIKHENCKGVIFYCSKEAFTSEPINDERIWTKQLIDKYKNEGKTFACFPVMLNSESIMCILKQVFDELPTNNKGIEEKFKRIYLDNILRLFTESMVYIKANQNNREGYLDDIFNALQSTIPSVIEMDLYKDLKEITFGHVKGEEVYNIPESSMKNDGVFHDKRGNDYYIFNYRAYEYNELQWLYLYTNDEKKYFISKEPVDILNGGEFLKNWLLTDFAKTSFNENEIKYINEIRLLTEEDLNYIVDLNILKFKDDLDGKKYWWIDSNGEGSLQKTMRATGEIYHYGFKPRMKKAGVRPVISIEIKNLDKVILK